MYKEHDVLVIDKGLPSEPQGAAVLVLGVQDGEQRVHSRGEADGVVVPVEDAQHGPQLIGAVLCAEGG